MALFNLHLQFNHKLYPFCLQSSLSSNDIKLIVADSFRISQDDFKIQVYDERFKNNFVLDDEHVERLRERLPHTSISTLHGEMLLNPSSSRLYVRERCNIGAEMNDTEFHSSFEWSMRNDENRMREEVVLVNHEAHTVDAYLEVLLITSSEADSIDMCQTEVCDYSLDSSQPQGCMDQASSLPSDDEIERNICHPDTSFRSNGNELLIIENADLEGQIVGPNVPDAVIKQPVSLGTNPLISSGQIARRRLPVTLSSSLQFVHDVHPHQKTQYDTDNSDECLDKNLAPYVMRLQGVKTDADKGKSILPRIKLPQSYIILHQQKRQPLYLLVAAVREEQVNGKRFWYTCRHMQFLFDGTNKITEAVNPVQRSLYSLPIESDGTFKLSLRLINNSSQTAAEQTKNRLFHELDEEIARNLHPTPYDPRFFRLVCTLVKESGIAWNTVCLSDYIRPKQRLET